MERRAQRIEDESVWETTDYPKPAEARRDACLAAGTEQKVSRVIIMTESLLRFADNHRDVLLSTQARSVPFRVKRSGTGLAFTLEKTQRTRPEPLSALNKIIERYGETKSLKPADYQDLTFNASYSLTLSSLFMAAKEQV